MDASEALRRYQNGDISRREFLTNVEKLAVGTVTVGAILEGLGMEPAQAQDAQANSEFQVMLRRWFAVREPSARHAILNTLKGKWDVLLRFYGGEQHWETSCSSRAELVHGGRFLQEQISGEISAPDENGEMRNEPFSATRIFGYDNYKKAYVGMFLDNQNTHMLTLKGHSFSEETVSRIDLFGRQDEPMVGTHDVQMRYTLEFRGGDGHVWSVFVLVDGEEARLFDFEYSKRQA